MLAGGRLTIDLDAIASNWLFLKNTLKSGTECAATIKADGYGTGAVLVAQRLWQEGCKTFCVALPEEGLAVRAALPDATIYILGGLFTGAAEVYEQANLRPALISLEDLTEWAGYCSNVGRKLPAAIHIDSGMSRTGLSPEDFATAMADSTLAGAFEPCLLMTHLACGSEPDHPMNKAQLAAFHAATDAYAHIPRSMSNSAGVFLGEDYHFDLARPGISLYGGKAVDTVPNPMAPVVKVEARIMMVRDVAKGSAIGYAAAATAKQDLKVAVVAAGYADGMHRRAGSTDEREGAFGWVSGHKVPLIGRISMDMMAIDVTNVPESIAKRGAFVEILGPNVAASDVAAYAETIDYEYLTGLGKRYHRFYEPLPAPDQS
ncbi:MAG: alanine racemase [Rhodobacteraceae bacterium]|nr:alanine racemase [Paracoccaceae bacterium]